VRDTAEGSSASNEARGSRGEDLYIVKYGLAFDRRTRNDIETNRARPARLLARLREAVRYLLDRRDATEEERRLATEAIDWLRSKRDEKPPLKTAEVSEPKPPAKQKRKGKA